ncbi:MAG TPA: hypothetical protein VFM25_06250 [Verrucomicrobiae bacterium]|nr:hypothetical protein [Verrucomicrobiae bacterium]
MNTPDSEEGDRKYWPPPVWRAKEKKVGRPPADPPISKRVKLPETVTVRYLAEITGKEFLVIVEELKRLRLFLGYERSLDFQAAARLLCKYGIGADRDDD